MDLRKIVLKYKVLGLTLLSSILLSILNPQIANNILFYYLLSNLIIHLIFGRINEINILENKPFYLLYTALDCLYFTIVMIIGCTSPIVLGIIILLFLNDLFRFKAILNM